MGSWGDAASVSQTLIQHYPSVSRVPGSLQDKKVEVLFVELKKQFRAIGVIGSLFNWADALFESLRAIVVRSLRQC